MEVQSAFNAGVAGFQQASRLATDSAQNIASETARTDENRVDETRQAEGNTTNANPNAVDGNTTVTSNRALNALATPEPTELTEELVNLRVAERQAQASARGIETADEVVGTLIDVRA